jgi:WD40 repeat protein
MKENSFVPDSSVRPSTARKTLIQGDFKFTAAAITNNGAMVIAATGRNLFTFKTANSAVRQRLDSQRSTVDRITTSAINPNVFLTHAADHIRLWDLSVFDKPASRIIGEGHFWTAVFNPNEEFVAAGDDSGNISIWPVSRDDVRQSQPEVRHLRGHQDVVPALAFSPDGKMLVSGGADMTVRIWDLETSHLLGVGTLEESRVLGRVPDPILSIAISPDSRKLITGSRDSTLRIWNISDGTCTTHVDHKGGVLSVAFNSIGKRIVSASESGIRIRSLDNPSSSHFITTPVTTM